MSKILMTLAAAGTVVGAIVFATAAPTAPSPRVTHANAAHPVVIELFQSQGCSSCPPALKVLEEEANRSDVLALNFAVTYWDQLGWKDIYAQPAFTARQWDYAHAQGRGNVQTPQLIVNGNTAVLGSFKPEVDSAIANAGHASDGLTISARGNMISIGASAGTKPATVWLVDYDPRSIQVPIRAGENDGRTLPHRNIVKRLTAIGTWNGAANNFTKLAPVSGAQAVLVQSGKGGAIVGAAKL